MVTCVSSCQKEKIVCAALFYEPSLCFVTERGRYCISCTDSIRVTIKSFPSGYHDRINEYILIWIKIITSHKVIVHSHTQWQHPVFSHFLQYMYRTAVWSVSCLIKIRQDIMPRSINTFILHLLKATLFAALALDTEQRLLNRNAKGNPTKNITTAVWPSSTATQPETPLQPHDISVHSSPCWLIFRG